MFFSGDDDGVRRGWCWYGTRGDGDGVESCGDSIPSEEILSLLRHLPNVLISTEWFLIWTGYLRSLYLLRCLFELIDNEKCGCLLRCWR